MDVVTKDKKRQLTAVLVLLSGDLLPPQLTYSQD